MSLSLEELLAAAAGNRASDVHLMAGSPPTFRIDGHIRAAGQGSLTEADMREILKPLATEDHLNHLARHEAAEFSFHSDGAGRIRASLFMVRGGLAAAFRLVPGELPDPVGLGLPGAVRTLANRHSGLVLVTGMTGSGKTTTMNLMVDMINRTRAVRILTIEDPIEFVHTPRQSSVLQREIGLDAPNFPVALNESFRQDPDVIVVGEMRDLETISTALTAAETGHLVLSTLHTRSASDTIQRIVDVFPAAQQNMVRRQLADSLEGVVSQKLVPNMAGHGRSLAFEVLLVDAAVRSIIREGRMEQLPNSIMTGKKIGMFPMDHCLRYLLEKGRIDYATALSVANDPGAFDRVTGVGEPQLLTS